MKYNVDQMFNTKSADTVYIRGVGWCFARPINYKYRSFTNKLKQSWHVFVGKADAMYWTNQ